MHYYYAPQDLATWISLFSLSLYFHSSWPLSLHTYRLIIIHGHIFISLPRMIIVQDQCYRRHEVYFQKYGNWKKPGFVKPQIWNILMASKNSPLSSPPPHLPSSHIVVVKSSHSNYLTIFPPSSHYGDLTFLLPLHQPWPSQSPRRLFQSPP